MVTTLSEGDSKEKHCFLLDVNRELWRVDPIPLRTARRLQFVSVRGAVGTPCARAAVGALPLLD